MIQITQQEREKCIDMYREFANYETRNHPLFDKAIKLALKNIGDYPSDIIHISIREMSCEWCDNYATVAEASLVEKNGAPRFTKGFCNRGLITLFLDGCKMHPEGEWYSCGCND